MDIFFPNLANDKNVQLQTAELTPSRINPKESIPGHIILKFLKTKGKEEFLKSSERNNTLHTGGKNSNNCISHKELWRPKRNDRVFFKYWKKITDSIESFIQHKYLSAMKEKLTFLDEG